jgi:hypothetical protein
MLCPWPRHGRLTERGRRVSWKGPPRITRPIASRRALSLKNRRRKSVCRGHERPLMSSRPRPPPPPAPLPHASSSPSDTHPDVLRRRRSNRPPASLPTHKHLPIVTRSISERASDRAHGLRRSVFQTQARYSDLNDRQERHSKHQTAGITTEPSQRLPDLRLRPRAMALPPFVAVSHTPLAHCSTTQPSLHRRFASPSPVRPVQRPFFLPLLTSVQQPLGANPTALEQGWLFSPERTRAVPRGVYVPHAIPEPKGVAPPEFMCPEPSPRGVCVPRDIPARPCAGQYTSRIPRRPRAVFACPPPSPRSHARRGTRVPRAIPRGPARS